MGIADDILAKSENDAHRPSIWADVEREYLF